MLHYKVKYIEQSRHKSAGARRVHSNRLHSLHLEKSRTNFLKYIYDIVCSVIIDTILPSKVLG